MTALTDMEAERAVLGALVMLGDVRYVSGLIARGLRPHHFVYDKFKVLYTAAVSLADRQSPLDSITLRAEIERLNLEHLETDWIESLVGYVPASGNYGVYADRVIELAHWRQRATAAEKMYAAAVKQDAPAYSRAQQGIEDARAAGRTESYSPDAWGSLLFDYFATPKQETDALAIPSPLRDITDALGGGIRPGEVLALSGPTSHGKSIFADQWLDSAAKHGKRCHLYMTEMTALARGFRYIARMTGVPFMRQRRNRITDSDRQKIIQELGKMPYGVSIAADWTVDDIVQDSLRARYDLVVVDLLHGFHYEDERGLDRLSKAMQRLARVSTTLDGHPGTAVIAVTHLKEEGADRAGKVPRPTMASIKGSSSIKQDADLICFVWQEQDPGGRPNGTGEVWIAKGRSADLAKVKVQLNAARFRFDVLETEGPDAAPQTQEIPF